jgi:hypothetical protein
MGIISKGFFLLAILLLFTSVTLAVTPTTITPTFVSISTPSVPDTIHLRIEFQTTSDWSDLTFLSSENISEAEFVSVMGDDTDYEINLRQVLISQPSENAAKGNTVGITFDLHMDPEALADPQFMLLERGDLNTSTVKIYYVNNDELFLIQEIVHDRKVLDQLGRNPSDFILELSAIQGNIDD